MVIPRRHRAILAAGLIWLSASCSAYRAQVIATKEAVLTHHLSTIRETLERYKTDKKKWPARLSTLVEAGYFKELPTDPMTQSTTWRETMSAPDPAQPNEERGVEDVNSMSEEIGSDGRSYKEW